MDILKIVGVGIIGALITLFLKNTKSEYAVFVMLATSLLILVIIIDSLKEVVLAFSEIVDKSGIDRPLFKSILRIVGIGYITEYSSSICSDFGAESIGSKIELAGKITIFLMAMPVVMVLIDSVSRLISL